MPSLIDNLKAYQISSKYGFVPGKPSQALGPAFSTWEAIAARLPQELAEKTLKTSIKQLPAFEVDKLDRTEQWQRAYVILGFLTHAWVHGLAQTVVPPILADPLLNVCDRLGMKPVLSYAGLCLFNWKEGDGEISVRGHQALVTFTDTLDEAAFYLVPVIVEKEGGILVTTMLEAQKAAEQANWTEALVILESAVKSLRAMVKCLEDLRVMNPDTFYHNIRPYIAGLNVIYEGHSGNNLEANLIGGSASQSSLFQVLDHLLGVQHTSSLPRDMRSFMPGTHRDFLEEVEKLTPISDFLKTSGLHVEIEGRLRDCLFEMGHWRSKHIAVVTRYIMLPAQAAARRSGVEQAVVGTAGSSPVAFLKQMRNDTSVASEMRDRPEV